MSSGPSAAVTSSTLHNTREMSFYEMSLLHTQFELDEVKECLELLHKNKAMIDNELREQIKLERELEAKSKRFKKILKSTYKTGDYSPSKYGLQPKTPVKQQTGTTSVIFAGKIKPCNPNNNLQGASAKDNVAEQIEKGEELLSGEDDDDALLLADKGGNNDQVSFKQAMDIVDENAGKEIGVFSGDTVGNKISDTSKTESGDKLTGDSVKGKAVDNSIINDTNMKHETVTGYGSGDKVVYNVEGGNKGTPVECNIDNDLADKNANATPNDDSLPFSVCRDIFKKYN